MTQAPERIMQFPSDYPEERIITWKDDETGEFVGMCKYIRADIVPQWQPIETAPKDGMSILIMVDDAAIQGHWVNNRSGIGGEWHYVVLNSHGCGCCGSDDPSPTHWMPLPSPPA